MIHTFCRQSHQYCSFLAGTSTVRPRALRSEYLSLYQLFHQQRRLGQTLSNDQLMLVNYTIADAAKSWSMRVCHISSCTASVQMCRDAYLGVVSSVSVWDLVEHPVKAALSCTNILNLHPLHFSCL